MIVDLAIKSPQCISVSFLLSSLRGNSLSLILWLVFMFMQKLNIIRDSMVTVNTILFVDSFSAQWLVTQSVI